METTMGPLEISERKALSFQEGIVIGSSVIEISKSITLGEEIPEMWFTIIAAYEALKRETVEC